MRRSAHAALAAVLLLAASPSARADAPSLTSTADLDGVYVFLGPLVSAVRMEDEWSSAAGLEASVVRVTERAFPAALGVAAGGFGYADRDGGRLWLEAEVAIKQPLPVAVGLGLGATAEIDRVRPPRVGGQATLWIFTGIIPYLRAGVAAEDGTYVEAGVMIKLPVARFVQ